MPIAKLLDGKRIDLIQNDVTLTDPDPGLTAMRLASDGGLWAKPHGGAEVAVGGGSAAGAGIGFDTLSNVLVVDPSFDSSTAGWGVVSFALFSAAVAVATEGQTIFVNGDAYLDFGDDEIHLITSINIVLFGESKIGYGGMSGFVSFDSGTYHIWGGAIEGLFHMTATADVTLHGTYVNLLRTYDSSRLTALGGAYFNQIWLDTDSPVRIDGCSFNHLIITSEPGVPWSCVTNSFINDLDGVLSSTDLFQNCVAGTKAAGIVVNPLNHSNTVAGITHREVVLVASLPTAASGNAGAMAATSDGGTGSIPALMYSNGTAWVVAAE